MRRLNVKIQGQSGRSEGMKVDGRAKVYGHEPKWTVIGNDWFLSLTSIPNPFFASFGDRRFPRLDPQLSFKNFQGASSERVKTRWSFEKSY